MCSPLHFIIWENQINCENSIPLEPKTKFLLYIDLIVPTYISITLVAIGETQLHLPFLRLLSPIPFTLEQVLFSSIQAHLNWFYVLELCRKTTGPVTESLLYFPLSSVIFKYCWSSLKVTFSNSSTNKSCYTQSILSNNAYLKIP